MGRAAGAAARRRAMAVLAAALRLRAAFTTWADEVAHRKLTAYAITEQLRQLVRPVHVTDDAEAQQAWEQAFATGSTLDEMARAVRGVADLLRLA